MRVTSFPQRWLAIACVMALAALTAPGLGQQRHPRPPQGKQGGKHDHKRKAGKQKVRKDILASVKESPELTTLAELLESSGLAETLRGKGTYTLFAPTNDAFKKMGDQLEELRKPENKAELRNLLELHLLPRRSGLGTLRAAKFVKTVSGHRIPIAVQGKIVKVGNASIVKPNIRARNGLIHVIDGVIAVPEKEEGLPKPEAP